MNTQTVPQKPPVSRVTKSPEINPKGVKKYDYNSTYVIAELKDMLEAAQADKQMITKIQLFKDKEYTSQSFSKWKHKYPNVKRIHELSKKIEEVIESNIITSGVSKNPAFFIFLLKNHYGYADKREVETETTHVFKVYRGDIKPLKGNKVVIPSSVTESVIKPK